MCKISFEWMEKEAFGDYAPRLFSILHGNMSPIAPTGSSYDEDYAFWHEAFGRSFAEEPARNIILIKSPEDAVIGFFMYSIRDNILRMEEIQIVPEYQGRHGIFRRLYACVLQALPADLQFVEAYAHRKNEKSLAILDHLGLKIVGENKSGSSHHLCGSFGDLLAWLRGVQ